MKEDGNTPERSQEGSGSTNTSWVGVAVTLTDIVENGVVKLAVGSGGVNQDFQTFLRNRLTPGTSPADLIVTMASRQVQVTQQVFMESVRQGMSFNKAKSAIFEQFSKEITSKAVKIPTQFEVLRVLRDSHTQAANAAVNAFAERNSHLVEQLERFAGGRACMACAALDGELYPVGTNIEGIDHVNGMCLLTPVLKPLSELGIPERPEYKAAWNAEKRTIPTASEKFAKMKPSQQRKLFRSEKSWNWWNENGKPDLKTMITKDPRRGWVPMTHAQLVAKFGGG